MSWVKLGSLGHIEAELDYLNGGVTLRGPGFLHEPWLTKMELESLVLLARGAQGLPLCPDSGPTPEGSGAVQGGSETRAKRSLDGSEAEGHFEHDAIQGPDTCRYIQRQACRRGRWVGCA